MAWPYQVSHILFGLGIITYLISNYVLIFLIIISFLILSKFKQISYNF